MEISIGFLLLIFSLVASVGAIIMLLGDENSDRLSLAEGMLLLIVVAALALLMG